MRSAIRTAARAGVWTSATPTYERTEPMLSNVLRDLELVDALRQTIVPLQDYLAAAADILDAGWPARGRRRRLLAAVRHAVDFQTWRSFAAHNSVTRAEAIEPSPHSSKPLLLGRFAQPPNNSNRRRRGPFRWRRNVVGIRRQTSCRRGTESRAASARTGGPPSKPLGAASPGKPARVGDTR